MAQGKSIPGRFRELRTQVNAIALGVLRKASMLFQQRMQARLRGPTGPTTLSRRTGALARSVASTVEKIPNGYRLLFKVGANAPYADVHERGKTITAKSAKNLAIPLAAAKTAAGVSRLASPRQDPTLKFVKSRSGKKLLVRFVGKGAKRQMIPHYVLKYSVRIPPRLGFRKEARGIAREAITELRMQLSRLAGRRRSS